jgi:hypothetical protein
VTPLEFDRALAEQMGRFYNDPLGFVMFAFPWGKKGTELENFPDGPDQWTRALFAGLAEHVTSNMLLRDLGENLEIWQSAVASGHGIGKSATVAWIILWLMSTRVNCRGIVTANTGDQLAGKTWPELSKWHNLAINKHWFKWTATQFYYALYDENRRKNYMFEAVTWSEERTEGFAGLHNAGSAVVMIEDEASAVPDKISEVISGALTDGEGFWFKFGNPTRNEGRFFRCFHQDRSLWWTLNVDSRDVRITNKKYLERLVEQYGEDSDYIRVRVRGQFPRAGEMQFIAEALVDECVARADPPRDDGAPLLLGIDVAVGGGDKVVMRFRQGLNARVIPAVKMTPDRGLGHDSITVASKAAEIIDRFEPDAVFIDEIGVGTGVADILQQLGYKLIRVNAGPPADDPIRFRDKKAEMWATMKQWMVEGGALPDDLELRQDLTAPFYDHTLKQQLFIESKKDMRRRGLASPDDADALALTFARKVRRKDRGKGRRDGRRNVAKGVDYDVLRNS